MLMLLFPVPNIISKSEPKMWRLRLGQAAICSGLPILAHHAHSANMGTKSRDYIYGSAIRASAERAKEAFARKLIGWLAKHRITGCSATRGRLSWRMDHVPWISR